MTRRVKSDTPLKIKRAARKVRPRIQRAFFRWLSENRKRFTVSIQIKKRSDRRIEISFVGINPVISIFLTKEIGVSVTWENEIWDYLHFFEVAPFHVKNGFICSLCTAEAREVFPDIEELWNDHLFEPFLEWVNNDLVPASHIGLYGTANECTYAELRKANPTTNESQSPPKALLPLWQHLNEITHKSDR